MKILMTCIVIFLLVAFYGSKIMAKDFPYDIEVVPGDANILVINTNTWSKRDCVLELSGPGLGSNNRYILPAGRKNLIIENLINGQKYELTVKRGDFLGRLRFAPLSLTVVPHKIDEYDVFLGASISKAWNLRTFSERHSLNMFVGYRGVYEFDKTALVEGIIKLEIKPNKVFIKECAAYFPRETKSSLIDIAEWVKSLKQAGVEPVLVTVVPITSDLAKTDPGRMQSINDFNNGLRDYSKKNNLRLLDLQKILKDNSKEMFLKAEYAVKDGLHLNAKAYKLLDVLLLEFINFNDTQSGGLMWLHYTGHTN